MKRLVPYSDSSDSEEDEQQWFLPKKMPRPIESDETISTPTILKHQNDNVEDKRMESENAHSSITERDAIHQIRSSIDIPKHKRSVVKIENGDGTVGLAKAIIVGKCHADQDESEEWRKRWKLIKQSNRPLQKQEALILLETANVSTEQPCGKDVYQKLQDILYPDYVVKVHQEYGKHGLVFITPDVLESSKVIHVYYHQNHYDCITNIKGFFGCSYYCERCDIKMSHREDHRCPYGCKACYSTTSCSGMSPQIIQCVDCKRSFNGQQCYDNHKQIVTKRKKSICDLVNLCEKCGKQVIVRRKICRK